MAAGAVYKPFVTVPIAGESDQLTPVLVLPLIFAVNCCDCAEERDAEVGVKEIATAGGGCEIDILAVAVLVGSAVLVAVSVTV